MEIIKFFPETLAPRTQYKMIKSPDAKKMSEAEDSVLEIKSWILYTDIEQRTGEVREVLTVETTDGEMFATVSEVFKREFNDIVAYFGDDVGMIRVIGGTSKSGRKFISCTVE